MASDFVSFSLNPEIRGKSAMMDSAWNMYSAVSLTLVRE